MNDHEHIVLAGDIGGTNAKLGLGRYDGAQVTLLARGVYPSRQQPSLEAAIDAFLSEPSVAAAAHTVSGACFAVAGPVKDGVGRLTNLPWSVGEAALARHLRLGAVRVINDFAAAGVGIPALAPSDLLTLQAGIPAAEAPRVILGAGTGLGIAILLFQDGAYRVHASEAGHGDFASGDAVQDALVRYLRGRFGHVSYERVVSGRGLPVILDFLESTQTCAPSRALMDAMAEGDAAPAVTRFALEEGDPAAVRALDLFVSAYGAFAGNMALTALAHGGVFVAGGIAPKIASKLEDGTFMRAFCAKGRFQKLLETIPVHVVMNEQVGLYGALLEAGRAAAVGVESTPEQSATRL
jgi:glucokinase